MKHCVRCNLAVADASARCLRCGHSLGADESPAVLVDGRYAVESEIGNGAMGVVYRARDVHLNRVVALKVIAADIARNASFVDRFRREAQVLAAIRNDHVVHVYAMGTHEGSYFYAMEFIEGANLEAVIKEHAAHDTHIPTRRALTILRQVAKGLAAVHAAGVVHRDVKPANIVIEEGTGRPVVLDFGLARSVQGSSRSTVAGGTPQYMAPEQIAPDGDGDPISARTDVYALACSAFEMLTGRTPFDGDNTYRIFHSHLHAPPPTLSSRRPDLAMLDPVLSRALAKNPEDRYESCVAFAEAIDAAVSQWRALDAVIPPVESGGISQIVSPSRMREFRVLIVDDDPMFCNVARAAVELACRESPTSIQSVHSGLRALTAALRTPPNLVLLDYDMPGLNGVETLSELRALPEASQAPVLVVSKNVGTLEQWRFGVLGVKDFLAKPVRFETLVEAVGKMCRRVRAGAAPTAPSVQSPVSAAPASVPPSLRLPREVFETLLAVGWADGTLDVEERDAVLQAAQDEGLADEDLSHLRTVAESPLDLGELDLTGLRAADRLYVYAMASWISWIDGRLTEREAAMLRVLALLLGLNAAGRSAMDAAVRALLADVDPMRPGRFDLAGLRRTISARVEGLIDRPGPRRVDPRGTDAKSDLN